MKIGKILDNLLSFLLSNRQTGTTSLLEKIAAENNVWVIVAKHQEKPKFNGKALTIDELNHARGLDRRPILIDNHTMLWILEDINSDHNNLLIKYNRSEKLIEEITESINRYNIGNKKSMIYNPINKV
jgi:hypothetical protein